MEIDNPTSEVEVEGITSTTDQYDIDSGDAGSSIINDEYDTEVDDELTEEDQSVEEQPIEEDDQETAEEVSSIQEEVTKNANALNAIKKDLKAKGVDLNQAVREYNATGALSNKTIAELVSAGYPEEVIETFLEGRQALEERFTDAVYKAAGGEQEYQQIIAWAKNNLPQKTLESYNRAIDNNNLEALTLMLEGIKAKRSAKMGTRNPSILGSGANKPRTQGFSSKEEVIKAFSDPRYGRDPAYMREMEMKMLYTDN